MALLAALLHNEQGNAAAEREGETVLGKGGDDSGPEALHHRRFLQLHFLHCSSAERTYPAELRGVYV
jgi:hypothetical protein